MACAGKDEVAMLTARVDTLEKGMKELQGTLAELSAVVPLVIEIRDACQAVAWVVKAVKYIAGLAAAVGTIYATATGRIAGLLP
jgi:hypothetical protein